MQFVSRILLVWTGLLAKKAWLLFPAAEYPVIWNKFEHVSSGLKQTFIQIQAWDSQGKRERRFGGSEGLSCSPGITQSCQVVFHLTDYRGIISVAGLCSETALFPKAEGTQGRTERISLQGNNNTYCFKARLAR